MESFDEVTKKEIIKLIELALEPIEGKVEKFGDAYNIRCMSRYGNEPEHRWIERNYPVIINTNIGKKVINLSSVHQNKSWDMVEVACRDFAYTEENVQKEIINKIINKIYSSEFISLRK